MGARPAGRIAQQHVGQAVLIVSSEDELADRFGEAVVSARERPALLREYGLPLPTRQHTRRVLCGYVAQGVDFPPDHNSFAPLSTLLGLDRVVPERSRFRFAEHGEYGEDAIIQPVSETGHAGDRDLLDLIAWHPARPTRWWMLDGLAVHLGSWPIDGEARLVATPLAWLRDTETLCLLNYSELGRLLELRRILVPDRQFGVRIYDELRKIALPEIEVVS